MKISRIHLKNFRTHADTEVVFPDEGVIGFLGPNGCGKSTIGIEALGFALYGSKATRGSKASLRWNRAPARHVASVELEFEVGGNAYRVVRSESDAKLFEDGGSAPIAAGTSAVDAYAPGLIGMSWDEFSSTYLCQQSQLQKLAHMGGTERRQFFLKVLGVGQIDDALKACRARKSELAREHDGIAIGLGSREGLESERDEAGARLQQATREQQRTQSNLSVAASQSEATSKALAELEGMRAKWYAADLAHAKTLGELERAASGLAAKREAGGAQRPDVTGAEERIRALEERRDVATRLGGAQEARIQRGSDARAEVSAIDAEATRIRGRIEKFDRLGPNAACPTCERALGSYYSDTRARLADELEACVGRRPEAYAAAERAVVRTDDELELESRLDGLDTAIGRYGAQDEALRRYEAHAADLKRAEAAESAAREAHETTKARLAEIEFDEGTYAKRGAEHEEATKAESSARALHATAEEAQRGARGFMERAKKALDAYQERAKKLAAVEADLRTHARASDRLSEFRAETASQIRPELEALASGFVQILTDGRHEGLILDEDLGARLLESGIETEVISGGTEDIAAIAMRLAISQMIAERAGHPLSLLILDEPFGSLDVVRRSNVLELIKRLASVFAQVVLISHVDETREAVDHAIELSFDEATGRTTVVGSEAIEAAA